MHLKFEATTDLYSSLSDVEILISFAKAESDKNEDNNRELFLKLSVSSLVTKFQVFIEAILKEFDFTIKNSQKSLANFPIHLRLNSLKIYFAEKNIDKKLTNVAQYNSLTIENLKQVFEHMIGICNENTVINQEFKLTTKFPLGKGGSNEVVDLFKQLNGEDLFDTIGSDKSTLDEILWKRHSIIHEDANPQLTEVLVEKYLMFIRDLANRIDSYIFLFK